MRRALAADRPEYLETEQDGATLRCRVAAPSASSARATLDDLLAAIQLAERTRQVSSSATPRSPKDPS
ncbi:MAG: hypothetical protein L3K03_03290 [Thermoplasmata archaeon]|nr:hypothetical protein [Thermoplasmata archaeon]